MLVNEDHYWNPAQQLNNDRPTPLAFPFHAFPPLKPPCLLLSGGTDLQIFLTVESWNLNAWAVSR